MFRSHASTSFSQTLMSVGKERISVTSMQYVLTHLGATNATAQLGIEGVDSFVVSEENANVYHSITSFFVSYQTVEMESYFSMMVLVSPLTIQMELYWFVWTMSMGLCVMTGGTLWMPQ